MDWSSHDLSIIASLDDLGGIVIWDIEKNTTSKLNLIKLLQMKKNTAVKVNFGKIVPNVIKFCPHQKDRLAIGMKGGLVCIISIKDSGKVLYTMRGHDKDVTSLAWCPVTESVFDSVNYQNEAFILASICRDRIIHFWRGVDGQFLKTVKLPNTYLGRHTRLPANSSVLCLDWPCKTTLISSSNYGEVLRYDIAPGEHHSDEGGEKGKDSELSASKGQWRLIHDIHPRGVFVIHAVNTTKEKDDDNESKGVVIWSTAQDRNLVAVCLDNGRILANIPTIGGFVYCMASSPFDPSRVAVGLGDYSIRIWNTGNMKEVQMSTLWQKIKGKVMAIAWHPVQEMKLAFGTHEGRVGIQDLMPGHLPILLVPRHRNAVYALSWGPPSYQEGEECHLPQFCLYSCGDGEILMYNTDNPDKEPMKMNSFIKGRAENKKKENTCTDIAWKPDYTLLAVGNNDGTVQLFSPPHLKLVYTLFAHRKLLMTLTWHPLSTSSDSSLSTMRHFIATGSNENVIQVFDLSSLVNAVSAKEEFKGSIQPIATLNGHQKKVVRLSWSPHTSGHLCSASYDDTVRVWDVLHQTCIGCFCGHIGACLVCMWSPMDPDIIISGSSDFTVCAWRISEVKDIPKSIQKASRKKKASPMPATSIEPTVKSDEVPEVPAVPLAKSAAEKKSTGQTWRGSPFPVSWKIAGGIGKVDGIRLLLDKEKGSLGNLDEPTIAKLGFYGNREDMHCLLKKEEAYHLAHENMEQAQLMSLWQGNVAEMLKDAISKGKLSDWLVSLAPSASHKLWLEACQAYSEQLTKSGKYNQAASYLLACHKVDEAIELLRSQSLFREALAIARCRLAPDDPTTYQLTLDWGRNLLIKGNYEIAAMCFTSIGEYLDAAKAIASRSTIPECVALGAALALKSGPQGRELGMILTLQCMHLYLSNNDWNSALECIKPLELLKPLSIVIQLHRKLVEGFQTLVEEGKSDLLHEWLEAGENKMVEEEKSSSILHLSALPFGNDSNITADEAYSCILSRRADKVTKSQKNFMVELGEELALAVCAASLEGENIHRRWHHILKSMRLCYSNQVLNTKETSQHPLFLLCFLLSPFGPRTIDILFDSSDCDMNKGFTRSIRAFYAYGAAMWAEDKWSKNSSDKPWNLLTNFLLSYLPDILDPITASYYKEDVEIHKREQEIAKEKALLRLNQSNCSTKSKKKQEMGKSEELSGTKDIISAHSDGICDIEGQKDSADDFEETIAAESLEDAVKEKESVLLKLKERREHFEKNRISAPNPYLCLYKLRIISEMAVTATENREEFYSKDVREFQEKLLMAKIDSS